MRAFVLMIVVICAFIGRMDRAGADSYQGLRERATKQFFKDYEAEKKFRGSVTIGTPSFELADPLSVNPYPQYGQAFTKLTVSIPLAAKEAGEYRLKVHYIPLYNSGEDGEKSVSITLNRGDNLVSVPFAPEDLRVASYWLRGSSSKIEVVVSQYRTEASIYGPDRSQESQDWQITHGEFPLDGVTTVAVPSK